MARFLYAAVGLGLLAGILMLLSAVAVLAGTPPVAEWTFDENAGLVAHDAIGGLNGALSATGIAWIGDGVTGSALRFSGGRVTIADDATLRTPTIGVRLWVRGNPDTPPADGQVILEKGDANCTGGAYALIVDGGHVALRYRETYPNAQLKTVTVGSAVLPSIWDGNWHLISFSSLDDQWGWVSLYQQGWVVGTESGQHAINHLGLTPTNLAIGAPANSSCSEAAFTGDIDDVAVYSRFLARDELAALEPPIPTSVAIQNVSALEVGKSATTTVKVAPVPLAAGKLVATLVDGDDVAHGGGQVNFDNPWQLPSDGVVTVPLSVDAAASKLKVSWQPSLPQLTSKASVSVSVTKAGSEANLAIYNTFIENETIDFSVRVSGFASVKADGVVKLYELIDNVPTYVAATDAVSPVGSYEAWAAFSLPPRVAGTYTFEATYQGSQSFLPSDSPSQNVVVHPALVTGQLAINNGDAKTDDPYVTVAVPATGAVAVQLSTDITNVSKLLPPESWTPTVTLRLTDPPVDDQDGLRTVWVKWADAVGHWTDWSSNSIVLDRGLESGTVTLDGGAAATNSASVSADVAVADPSKVTKVQLSNDGTKWTTMPYSASVSWTLASGNGQRTVQVRWVDALGRQSVGSSDSISLDTVAPTVSALSTKLEPAVSPAMTIPIRASWTGSDATGIANYAVSVSKDGGSWSTLASHVANPTLLTSETPGHTYRFRVRATDLAGNVSAWQLGTASKLVAAQENSAKITYSGTWSKSTIAGLWNGASKFSIATIATATLKLTGRAVEWIAPTGPTMGQARVYVDGHLDQTINLWSSTSANSHVVYQHSWSSSAAHKIKIEVVGTAGHKRVDIDGFAFLT